MQLPFRPKEKMKKLLEPDEPTYLTAEGIDKLARRLKQIEECDLPQAIIDVRQTGEFGDFSENAEYQEAKARMRRLRDQATGIREKLKTAIVIEHGAGGAGGVQLGSVVVLETSDGQQKKFEIVGPQETDPLRGRLSFKSPLGAKLLNRTVGESVSVRGAAGEVVYTILEIA
jgi:transcription elongation GreA/GreB family factor